MAICFGGYKMASRTIPRGLWSLWRLYNFDRLTDFDVIPIDVFS
jgi:hypothetical protein